MPWPMESESFGPPEEATLVLGALRLGSTVGLLDHVKWSVGVLRLDGVGLFV